MNTYEKKYKELIEKIESISHSALTVEQHQIIDTILGELKESEDEKIRKEIKQLIQCMHDADPRKERWITWLEKQGETFTKRDVDNAYIEGMAFAKHELDKQGNSFIKWNKNTEGNKPQVNHSILMKTTHGIAEGEWKGGEHWIQYRWSGSIKDSDVLSWMELSDLDKQGEQKPIIEMKSPEESLGISSKEYNDIVNDCLYGESKSTDKTEPKFKVGDWILNDYCMGKVVELTNDAYLLDTEQGIPFSYEHNAHLWTIQDAKDGDILACNEEILLFKSYSVQDRRISLYCWYNGQTNNFHSKEVVDTLLTTRNKICPATKEQRDTLMKAMTDAGCTFDFEKKELRKRNSYCQEHCKGYQETGKCFADGDCKDKREAERKFIWSEDDEYKLNMCITAIDACYKWDSMVDWLKSLKERIKLWKK